MPQIKYNKQRHNRPQKARAGRSLRSRLCFGRYGSTRMKLYILILLSLLGCSCSIVEIEDYIHEPTNDIRNSIDHWSYSRLDKLVDEQIILIPNFRTFSASYSFHVGQVVVLSEYPVEVAIDSVSIWSDNKKEVSVELNKKGMVSDRLGESKFYYLKLHILRMDDFPIEAWNSEPKIWVKVNYRFGERATESEVFNLKLVTKKEVAWPT